MLARSLELVGERGWRLMKCGKSRQWVAEIINRR
jgi:hypothetical protein